ncbi:phage portal protein [Psychrobacillus sp. Sa2BUA9]|uniref:Phage portal protein n=1 Tax=Psychrobacillus faecigallinarum TaxID=2762235 RepID=A0ABR8RFE3_9BACI|nr:phage portal protein [Psychrobacillus faecigallinarum]MBD7946415.1 phage portal protein [Psychrobacillus faecigallinarum]
MGWLTDKLRKNKEIKSMFDLDLFQEPTHRAYLKKMALETCINFIGRAISQSDFRFMKDGKRQINDWDYLLNIRPNTDQSAAEFWQDFVFKLIHENEVLAILTDSNDLLIADSFDREEYAVFPDVFSNVTVKDYTFNRTFKMDEVIFIPYNNEKLTTFMQGMFDDYGDLFGRMIEINMRNNQIRGTVDIESTQSLDKENQGKLQNFIDRLFKSFKNNTVAIVPQLKGFKYTEVAKGDNNGKSVEELSKLKRDLVNEVAIILGIPVSLIHGDMTEYETAIKAYIKFCIGPLNKKISDELNAKLIEKENYLKGENIKVQGISELNALEVADAVDKLRASGVYNGNQIRVKLGDEPVDNPLLEEYVMTKNYESTKGGENKNERN